MQTQCLVLSTSSKRSLDLTTLKMFEVVKNGKSSQGMLLSTPRMGEFEPMQLLQKPKWSISGFSQWKQSYF